MLVGGRAFDPSASQIGWGRGHEPLARAMRASGVDPSSIDAVVCSASGSRDGDRLEAHVLRELFGARVPPLLVPKAVLGEYGAGVLVPALLALEGARFARPAGFRAADPELGLVPHDGELSARRVLVEAFAAGGAAAWVVLERA
jgi:3-oxoacyl-(acyl-carrier-protein) synthase